MEFVEFKADVGHRSFDSYDNFIDLVRASGKLQEQRQRQNSQLLISPRASGTTMVSVHFMSEKRCGTDNAKMRNQVKKSASRMSRGKSDERRRNRAEDEGNLIQP